jgi:hypothetical protein
MRGWAVTGRTVAGQVLRDEHGQSVGGRRGGAGGHGALDMFGGGQERATVCGWQGGAREGVVAAARGGAGRVDDGARARDRRGLRGAAVGVWQGKL